MSTNISVEYDREFTNFEIQEIIARATVTLNVMQQLGVAYQSLPGVGMTSYQTLTDELEGELASFNTLVTQLVPVLTSLDAQAGPLNRMNQKVLKTLRGLLQTSVQVALLDQITGPTPQGGGGTPTPPPPTP